jgi:hypothetical protein
MNTKSTLVRDRNLSDNRWDAPGVDASEAEHERWMEIYAKKVALLFDTGYKLPDDEYARLKAEALEARLESEIARIGLERHRRIGQRAN